MNTRIGIAVLAALSVGGSAWAGQPNTNQAPQQLRLELNLIDGSRIIGGPAIESVFIQTSYARMAVPLKQILTIEIENNHETASLNLRNGDKLKGVINMEPLKLETVFGKVAVGIEHIKDCRVILAGGMLPDALKQILVLHYPFNKDGGGKVTDESGKGNDGILHNTKWVQEIAGKGALVFSGGDSWIDVPLRNADIPTDSLTFNLWFKGADFQSQNNPMPVFFGDNSSGNALYVHLTTVDSGSKDHAIAIGNWVDYRDTSSAQAWKNNQWHMLTLSRTPSETRAYLDRKLVATQSPPKTVIRGILRFSGYNVPNGAHGFTGQMDEISVFNRALTEDEINALFEVR